MNGTSLIIDAGVSIKLENNTTIQVNGELKAVGDSVNKITFTSNNSSPSNGDWNHTIFSDNSKDAVYNSEGNYQSGSIIKYCEFSYGGSVNLGTININNGMSINSIENLILDIEIYSMQGKLVKKQSIVNYKDYIKIQRETLKPDIYLCKIVIDNKHTKTTKLLANNHKS